MSREGQKTDERYRLVVEAAPNALIMMDGNGAITLDNRQAEKLFGYEEGELLGRNIESLAPRELDSNRGDWRGVLAEAAGARQGPRETTGRRKDGSAVPLEIVLSPVGEADGKFVLASISDITERKRFEAELQSKAIEMERFTYTVSHDLKSPLITIKSFISMIERDLAAGKPERTQSDLRRVAKAADRMELLLEEVLALSRVGRVEEAPETVAFALLAVEALELVNGRILRNHVEVEIAEGMPTVTVDRIRVVEVLQNLIDNAAKFMGSQTEPKILIGVSRLATETRYFVKDNGMGLDAKYHERIFGLFDKLNPKSEGSGAGLAIAKRIIELHGGRIWVESAGEGAGATFWFTLNELPGRPAPEPAGEI